MKTNSNACLSFVHKGAFHTQAFYYAYLFYFQLDPVLV